MRIPWKIYLLLKTNMENEVKVSVFCLAYNHEKYIRHTLDGFVMQKTNFKFEVLVHDDASTDSTAAIIREYEKKYPDIIKPIYQKENQYSQHVNITRNFFLPIAQGKYVAFCEGDDYWTDPSKLQMQFDVMEAHPECSICVHKVQKMKEGGELLDAYYPSKLFDFKNGKLDRNFLFRQYFKVGYLFHTSSYFIRSTPVMVEGNNSVSVHMPTDDQQTFRYSIMQGELFYLVNVMSCRRVCSHGSWTERNATLSLKEKLDNLTNYIVDDIVFNRQTGGRYYNFIYAEVVSLILKGACHDIRLASRWLKKNPISIKILVEDHGYKTAFKYYLARSFPQLFVFLCKLKLVRNRY